MIPELKMKEAKSSLVIKKSLVCLADDLAKEHENFNESFIVGGRKALYELLGKIYALSEQLELCADKDEIVKRMRFDLLKRYKIKTQGNSTATAILVRYITRADRKSVHVYARAIEVAKSKGVSAKALPNFLEEQGGIEQLRSVSVGRERLTDSEEALEIAKKVLMSVAEKPFAKFELNQNLHQFGACCQFDYFITVNTGGNRFSVVTKIDANEEFEKRILMGFAESLDLQNSESKEALLAMINKGERMRDQRREANKNKPFADQYLLRGEFPYVHNEQFNALFDNN